MAALMEPLLLLASGLPESAARPWVYRLLNIESAAGFVWVSIGVIGQVVFSGRMVVQWIQSERRRESVVTPVFWWMSLVGSIMLILYFSWRRDLVGVLGQGAFFIYVRNLMLIARHKQRQLAAEVAAEGSDQP
ncbi:MAG: lipid-A-disaccharide synthase N-terminal domain-containing protein [Phycisphaeraceae bacterium]|nr:lipid-A-disaccharide synthase N-terminal domain-containing protein [Phycisphaeraceae bacterium]